MRDGSYVIVDRLCEATTQLLEIIKKQEEIIEHFPAYRHPLLERTCFHQLPPPAVKLHQQRSQMADQFGD